MSQSLSGSPTLSLKSVWKLFGPDADRIFKESGESPTSEHLKEHDLVPAVRDVTLDVRDGECFVIMGLSGSGKSTLVRCMSRLIEPTAGQVLFRGEDLLTASSERLIEIRRHHMGMVFQHFALLPHLNVLANVAFPLEIQGVARNERDRKAQEMVDLVGLTGRETFYPRELSGGQQQRVGIARSLCSEPDVWLLDEPFSALDPLIRREMQDEFMRLQSVLEKSIVFITHDFDEAIRVADRIAIMKDGAVVQTGTPDELVLAPGSDYVAEFTRNVSKSKVLKVDSVMRPLTVPSSADDDFGVSIKPGLTVADAAPLFVANNKPLRVVDDQNNTVGRLMHDDVVALMMKG